jgi:predicted nucleic acid-binding protein
VSLYYADTSAVIKLLVEETHSKAFAAFYDGHADAEWVSSALVRIELTRAVARAMPALLPEARDLLTAFSYMVYNLRRRYCDLHRCASSRCTLAGWSQWWTLL